MGVSDVRRTLVERQQCFLLRIFNHDDDDDDDDDDTAVGDGSIDGYDAVLFICVVLLLCVRWGHCSCCSAPLSAWCRSVGRSD